METASSLLVLAAAMPALALDAGLVGFVPGLPLIARTRVDLLGEHGREVGTLVVVSTTSRDGRCHSRVLRERLALEIGERLAFPEEVALVADGLVVHASVTLSSNRGGDYVADITTRLWDGRATR